MKFNILSSGWEIKEVEPNNSMLLINGKKCKGTTHYFHREIYLDSTLDYQHKVSTLNHELAHAFLTETQMKQPETTSEVFYTEEDMCEFVGIYACIITGISDKYFKKDGD